MIKQRRVCLTKKLFLLFAIISIFSPLSAIDIEEKWDDGIKVALVLSGGGARGFAHIPIIEAIERHNIPIDMVVGTSMGALVGGLYAAGYSPQDMINLIEEYDMVELFAVAPAPFQKPILSSFADYSDNIMNLSFDTRGVGRVSGLIGDQKILEMLNSSLINVSAITNFNHLPIPFRCVGTNLVTGEEIVFSTGSLSQSIRASISIPGIFTPAIIDDALVIDGGLVNNLPIDIALEMGADVIIAVDVNAIDYEVSKDELSSLTSILGQLVVILTKNTIIKNIDKADVLFSPLVEEYGILDFASYKEIIEIGRTCSLEMDDALKELSEQICAIRECHPIVQQRIGSYFRLPEIHIDEVIHTRVKQEGSYKRNFPLDSFKRFDGAYMNKELLDYLHFILNEERELHQVATISHQLTSVRYDYKGLPHGVLEIQTKEFELRNNRLGLGLFGSTHLSISPSTPLSFYFNPDFSFTFHMRKVCIPNLELLFHVVEKDFVSIFSSISYTWLKKYTLGIKGNYQVGSLHAFNASPPSFSGYGNDYALVPELFFEIFTEPYLTSRLNFQLISMWYENNDSSFTSFVTPSIGFDGVYARQKFTLFPIRGTRLDFSGRLLLRDKIGYRVSFGIKQSLRLSYKDSLLFQIKGGSNHSINYFVDDYFEYGGLDGIITKPANTVVKDMIIGGISYFHWIKIAPIPIVLQTNIKFGLQGKLAQDIYSPTNRYMIETSPSISFSSGVDIMGSLGIGFTVRNTDLLIGIAVDNSLATTLYVEVR